jgi:hypothetical protein
MRHHLLRCTGPVLSLKPDIHALSKSCQCIQEFARIRFWRPMTQVRLLQMLGARMQTARA